MKRLVGFVLLLALAVGLTLATQGQVNKVVWLVGSHRVDMSLNLFIVLFLALVFLVQFIFAVVRSSSQIPQRFREFFSLRKHETLHKAHRQGLLAYIFADDAQSAKALAEAERTGLAAELDYLLRALTALETHNIAEAERMLSKTELTQGQYQTAAVLLMARVHLAKQAPAAALASISALENLLPAGLAQTKLGQIRDTAQAMFDATHQTELNPQLK